MFDTIAGLPAHPLIVHATVIIVPLAAVIVGLAASWRRFRLHAGPMPLVLSAVALVLVPVTVQSGKSFKDRLEDTALIDRHADLGEGLLPWVAVVTLAAIAVFWLRRQELRQKVGSASTTYPRWLVAAVVILTLAGTTGSIAQVLRIGHSGAEAAWTDVPATTEGSQASNTGG